MATYGDVRFRLAKAYPTVDPDLIDGWIDDRYRAILDALQWQRRRVEAILQTTAEYATGTVAVTQGSTAVTGTDTVWTAAMSGRGFRVDGRDEIYTFTRTGDTTGTLDRAYEGDDDADATYRIFQQIYALPAACRLVESFEDLDTMSRAELSAAAPGRPENGTPEVWAPYPDTAAGLVQVELYPIPDESVGIPYSYFADAADLSAGATSAALLPWVRPAALIAGATADILRHLKEWQGAREYEGTYEARVADMRRSDAASRPAAAIRMANAYTDHRVRRGMR
jgi:hypothetical protein